jgi:hypothetical protein
MVGKRTKLGILAVVAFVSSAQAVSYRLDFIPMKFDEFVEKFLSDKNDVISYKEFHLRVLDKRQQSDDKQKSVLNRYLYRKALDFLQKNHVDWYASLQPYITDPIITLNPKYNDIRLFIDTFLVRLGTLEEFQAKKLAQTIKSPQAPEGTMEWMWNSVKGYASAAKNTVSGWFGLSQKPS